MTTTPKKENQNILVNTYMDDTRFGGTVRCVEMTLDTSRVLRSAEMHFILRNDGTSSVSLDFGTQNGMTVLTKDFIKTYKPASLRNQVGNLGELKAMYKAGLRYYEDGQKVSIGHAAMVLAKRPSIMLEWRR